MVSSTPRRRPTLGAARSDGRDAYGSATLRLVASTPFRSSPSLVNALARAAAGALVTFSLVACAAPQTNQPAGSACIRSTQCAPGLACSGGICTNDLSALAEAGTLPPLDMGANDGEIVMEDLGEPVDMGPPPPPVDMGPPVDMFVPPVDMFVPPVDMFVPPDPDLGADDLG